MKKKKSFRIKVKIPKKKRKPTPRQLAALARGREILFQKQLRQRGISLNPNPQIVRKNSTYKTTIQQYNLNLQLSLFKNLMETRLFSVKINENKQLLSLKQMINYLLLKLNEQRNIIISNQNKIAKIVNDLNLQNREYQTKLKQLEKRISDLEKENSRLKEQTKIK